MNYYIRSTGNISPQKTFRSSPGLVEAISHSGNRLNCVEPDYKEYIDIKLIRRMSRIIRMGVAAATECLEKAGVTNPDAIITGTAYGCLEDTIVFLKKLVENKEEMLSPAAFIQSTHNTVGAQIALMLKCNSYNNTFTSRGFSFENALLDAMMLINEGDASNVLVGGVDEITDTSHAILSRFDLYRDINSSSLDLLNTSENGTIAGEGASWFLLSDKKSDENLAQVIGLQTFFKPIETEKSERNIITFLSDNNTELDKIDLIITGDNGDADHDKIYKDLRNNLFMNNLVTSYKHFCGEYPTSSSFALWIAVHSIRNNSIPFQKDVTSHSRIKNVLIYNSYLNLHHSLILLSSC